MHAALKRLIVVAVVAAAATTAVVVYGPDKVAALLRDTVERAAPSPDTAQQPAGAPSQPAPATAVTVVTAAERPLVDQMLVTGTLVARDEVLVAPQVEGQRIVALKAEEGQRVAKGDVLAVLVSENIDAQLAQNAATIRRAEASIAQAESAIVQAEARLKEAQNAYERAVPLARQGNMPTSTLEAREAAAVAAKAAVGTARDGLAVARAEKAQAEAQRREIEWRRDNTEIRAPAAGIISRRTARVGAMASAQGEPLFRIIAEGAIELDAEVPEASLARIVAGQKATVTAAGGVTRPAVVRLVSPEIDRATRLGRVRLMIGEMGTLKIGGFAKAAITVAEKQAIAIAQSAIMYDADGAYVLAVEADRARMKRVTLGITSGGLVEVLTGLGAGDVVVARAGTFLRDGDAVRAVPADGATPLATGGIGRAASSGTVQTGEVR